ncbi:MAG TPA: ATP-dependent Clp protease proteolytic subunit [Bacteroidales bacterium]|nr:ATP-dependent Clp protease proteolytic subunit [Bacteroidales bacterium]
MTKKKNSKLDYDKFDELNEDFNSSFRTIYLETSIEFTTISFFTQRVDMICDITQDASSEITIEISTMGGDAFAMFGLIDTIKSLPMPINVLGRGAVFSAGAIVLATATGTRAVTENTYVMVHSASGGFSGSTNDIEIEAGNVKDVSRRMFALLGRHTKKPSSYWEKSCKQTLYLSSEQCLELGIVDRIWRNNEESKI